MSSQQPVNSAVQKTSTRRRWFALEIIRYALDHGLAEAGEVPETSDHFVSWGLSPEQAVQRIAEIWSHYDDPRQMMGQWWLNNTELGTRRAKMMPSGSKAHST